MHTIYALMAACMLLGLSPAPSDQARDIVIVVDVSAMTSDQAGDEPWLASPCLNPAHHYYKPRNEAESDSTYPASSGEDVDASVEYPFRSCFLLEEEAVGWRPWENHFAYDDSGALVRITDPESAGCVYASDLCRALAAEMIGQILGDHPECRVALCCVGGPFDTRFCVNFTRDEEKLVNALYAAPPSGIGDPSTALNKAGEYLQRRNADERRARAAAVVVISVGGEGDGLYAERTKKEALRLIESAALIWVSPLEAQGKDILSILGFEGDTPVLRPRPIFLRAAGEDRVYLAQ
jgi:hypothetical protein